MSKELKLYVVTDNETEEVRLVWSSTPGQAIRFVVDPRYTAEIPSQRELVDLLGKGAQPENVPKPPEADGENLGDA